MAAAGKPLETPARGLDAALHAPHLEAAAADVSRVVSALSSALQRSRYTLLSTTNLAFEQQGFSLVVMFHDPSWCHV